MLKRVLMIILIFCIFTLSITYGSPATTMKTVTMTMDGKNISFNTVNLKLNNQLIESDVPPVLLNDRTLVPLRAIIENIDAEIDWDGEKREVIVNTDDKEIVLKIDSDIANVNGVEKSLPDGVPAKLINSRTMVPIRFVAEEIGMEIEWEAATWTVLLTEVATTSPDSSGNENTEEVEENTNEQEEANDIEGKEVELENVYVTKKGLPEVRIKLSQEADYDEIKLIQPTRLVFDLKDTKLTLLGDHFIEKQNMLTIPVNKGGIKELRLAQFNKDPYVTRVVLEVENNVTHRVYFDKETSEMVISFVNYVTEINTEIYNTKEIVVIEGNNVENYNVMRLSNPERLVVDIMDAYIDTPDGHYSIKVDGRVAKNIRVSQFVPDDFYEPDDKIVRVVIDLQDKEEYEDFDFEIKDKCLWVHLEGKPYQSMTYEAKGFTNSTITFKGTNVTRYTVNRNGNSDTLDIIVPKNNIKPEYSSIEINDYLIKNITVTDISKSNYLFQIELHEDVEHLVASTQKESKNLVINLKNTNKYKELLVVIDPGHGGQDPGACPNILKESDVVLDISQRLNKLLTEEGFRTYMTRDTDVKVDLRERAAVANQLAADLFVSIHANSAPNPDADGIENLYYPSEEFAEDNRDNKRLAETFQKTMVKMLDATNRRLLPKEKIVVLRETKMPSVLTEVGFLSNKQEEAKLATEEYRQKVAEALLESIIIYFEEGKK
ncbi:AMIN domain-containing protein [Alkaliphilus pronyensis]|uniref:AMIN domain-containing protein n=1 Tax=Alkaliphilus pronyensis TaxID=1482732 RepID=A0A6I0EWF9_9FIRM|nr:N-acetylmuramoyl-L-alanine amidase family protein [Alkaliphilus pronyensis]KAB3529610.1 AMIN domain-containing protein [Alkaliphilus pronyensis]